MDRKHVTIEISGHISRDDDKDLSDADRALWIELHRRVAEIVAEKRYDQITAVTYASPIGR